MGHRRESSDEMNWLANDIWAKRGPKGEIIEGYKSGTSSRVQSGVEQTGFRCVYHTDIYEIWHKPGRVIWEATGQFSYEPATMSIVWPTGERLGEYACWSVLKYVETRRGYHSVRRQLIREIETRYRGDSEEDK